MKSSLADQLAAINPKRASAAPARAMQAEETPLEPWLQLPRWGRVLRLNESGGFGFLSPEKSADDLFFHVKGRLQCPAGARDPAPGDAVLFIVGTDPRKPNQPCAVRWALAGDLEWGAGTAPVDQGELDALRRASLAALPWSDLWPLLLADWYVRRWRGAVASADLRDPLLGEVWLDRVSRIGSEELKSSTAAEMLKRSRYGSWAASSRARWLDRLTSAQLAGLQEPHATWMTEVPPEHQQKLMEWYLLRSQGKIQAPWQQWFQGGFAFESKVVDCALAHKLPPTAETRAWVRSLAGKGRLSPSQAERWVEGSETDAVALIELLPEQRLRPLVSAWRSQPGRLQAALSQSGRPAGEVLQRIALAVDLETDGEATWEIGIARAGRKQQLFPGPAGESIADAWRELSGSVDANPLVVGHNLLAWDWPVIARNTTLGREPLLWDTLLVQYFLEPRAISHAIGGDHHADSDALLALRLFEAQCQRLPNDFAELVLTGGINSAGALLKEAFLRLEDSLDYARAAPDWLPPASADSASPILVVADWLLHDLDWVPGVSIVSAHPEENLPEHLLEVDVRRLEHAMQALASETPPAEVMLAVVKAANAQGIAIRLGMIPVWLRESTAQLDAALRQACHEPRDSTCMRVSPVPMDCGPLLNGRIESPCRFVGFADGTLVSRIREWELPHQPPPAAPWPKTAPLVRIADTDGGQEWALKDVPALRLHVGGGWRTFRTIQLPSESHEPLPLTAAAMRLRLAAPGKLGFFPGANDQAAYWTQTVLSLRTASEQAGDAVTILLVTSTSSRELLHLLVEGVVALDLGEVRLPHRSRLEHLRRAARRRLVVVDFLERWRDWLALADSIGIALQGVVESLPLEQWYAACQPSAAISIVHDSVNLTPSPAPPAELGEANDDEDVLQPVEAEDAGESEDDLAEPEDGSEGSLASEVVVASPASSTTLNSVPTGPSAGTLLERTIHLVPRFLPAWMVETGLSQATRPTMLLDARLGSLGRELDPWFERYPPGEKVLPRVESEVLAAIFEPLAVQRQVATSDLAEIERFFVTAWNRQRFTDMQRPVIEKIVSRSTDVLVALPTGAGKSVLFQVPALRRGLDNRRLTLVLSPLKALMVDQVDQLRALGFADSADYLNSDRPHHEITDVLQGVLDHRIVLLYVAPERLRNSGFIHVLRQRAEVDEGLEYIVFDETHCVNQWGYQFRPDYLRAFDFLTQEFRSCMGPTPTPFLMLSATVTSSDREALRGLLEAAGTPEQATFPLAVLPEIFQQPLRGHIAVEPQRVQGAINSRRSFAVALEARLPVIVKAIEQARENTKRTNQRSAVIIFVSRRKHADVLAQKLGNMLGGGVDCFHAGLDAKTRETVYEDFKAHRVNVLVATKAFGMGMDIPDIHWVIHLGPPAYLEDYLQEVGRIGRGVDERERAGLDHLTAHLLFSPEDFEGIRVLHERNAVLFPAIAEHYKAICSRVHPVGDRWMAIVPHEGHDPDIDPAQRRLEATQLRLAIHWLERAGALTLQGSIPNLLPVTLHRAQLQQIAKDGGLLGRVADAILEAGDLEAALPSFSVAASASKPGGLFSAIFGALGSLVGLLLGTNSTSTSAPTQPVKRDFAAVETKAGLINVGQLAARCSLRTTSEVMGLLSEIERRRGLELKRALPFTLRKLGHEPIPHTDQLLAAVEHANLRLLGQLKSAGRCTFDADELSEGFAPAHADPVKANDYQWAYRRGTTTLARCSGLRVREVVRTQASARYEASMPLHAGERVDSQRRATMQMARSVLKHLRRLAAAGETTVPLSALIDVARLDGRFNQSRLKQALNLLSAMNLASLVPDMVPLSYVLTLDSLGVELDAPSQQPLWDELKKVHRMARLRQDAMEVYANLPAGAQDRFVEEYFAQQTPDGLENLLIRELSQKEGEVDGSLLEFFGAKLQQLQATEVEKFFDRYRVAPQEPNQWLAISHPYDQHLLVNAGPGAGKTSVLIGRVVHVIREQQIAPKDIVVLAFNRAVVFEIRRRLRDLFRTLGYGAHVRSVRISTFHAFAMQNLANAMSLQDIDSSKSLQIFKDRLKADPSFRRQVAGSCRCILVDEFQDASDDIYEIVMQLYEGTAKSAGVMVIGDDDQDIYRWTRVPGHPFAERYFRRFHNDFGGNALSLRVNFRSGKEIVDRSQRMVSKFFERPNAVSRRMKDFQLIPIAGCPPGRVSRLDAAGHGFESVLADVQQRITTIATGESLAILCRTNSEVATAHEHLASTLPALVLHGTTSVRLDVLRHVGLWLEYIDRIAERTNLPLTPERRDELIGRFSEEADIPDLRGPGSGDVQLEKLWNLCTAEVSYPHLTDLARFIRDLRQDEFDRMASSGEGAPAMLVTTIHKVKGLEFDNVIVLPSGSPFSREGSGKVEVAMDAAEEARLLYVAMTRAKMRLTYYVGDRESAWGAPEPHVYPGFKGGRRILAGDFDEVALGWSMERNQFNADPDKCQAYIERHVSIGDSILLGGAGGGAGSSLVHNGRQVGFLAKASGRGDPGSKLHVSAVVRFRVSVDELLLTSSKLSAAVRERGWAYVVLVAGRL